MLAHGHVHNDVHESADEEEKWTGPTWTEEELRAYIEHNDTCIVLIDGYAVDVTRYMKAHVRPFFLSRFSWNAELVR
jgi:cytochrome b involved in lipid metabolism